MNFISYKGLTCRNCSQSFLISEESFPEDLHDLLVKYKLPQLSWICKSCKKNEDKQTMLMDTTINSYGGADGHDLRRSLSEMTIKFQTLQKELVELQELKADVHQISSVVAYIKNYIEQPDFKPSGFFYQPVCDEVVSPDSTVHISKTVSLSSSRTSIIGTPKKDVKMGLNILQDIIKGEIKIDNTQATRNALIVDSFIQKNLIPELKQDEVFKKLFVRHYCTGSSYNDLRISEATEYDINIVLKMPPEILLEVEFYANATSFAKVKWSKVAECLGNKLHVLKFLQKHSENSSLIPSKLNSWLQSLINKFILGGPIISEVMQISEFQSGPARTVKLKTEHGDSICIDLVPVFEFDYSKLEDMPVWKILEKYPVEPVKEFWFVVPKSCNCEQKIMADELMFSWRVYFPEVERAILYNKQCVKSVIKLLKLLRDKHNWKFISSYHCKTVIFWKINENPNLDWSGAFLYQRFLEALRLLQKYVRERNLPFFFNPEYNLFWKWCKNEDYSINLSNRLQSFISSIEENPENLNEIFVRNR